LALFKAIFRSVAYDRRKMRKAIKVVLGCLVALVLIVGAFAAWLIYPGSCRSSVPLMYKTWKCG